MLNSNSIVCTLTLAEAACFVFLQVDWGEASMITAERILLSHALKDPLNERFVFVSDRYTVQ